VELDAERKRREAAEEALTMAVEAGAANRDRYEAAERYVAAQGKHIAALYDLERVPPLDRVDVDESVSRTRSAMLDAWAEHRAAGGRLPEGEDRVRIAALLRKYADAIEAFPGYHAASYSDACKLADECRKLADEARA
jgi:hypothetical protein